MNRVHQETGVADLLGAIVLITVITLGVSIAAVAILSSPVPQNTPSMSVDVKNTTSSVYLTHNGGDSLKNGEYQIFVDGVDKTPFFTKDGAAPGNWLLGETLIYPITNGKTPENFQIIYTNGDRSQVIVQVFV